ncbi:MAG: Dabb family protein, partial [Rhizobiales bacterium]|nr:Dabb family protein [Hyphomicrobiales bacterium]
GVTMDFVPIGDAALTDDHSSTASEKNSTTKKKMFIHAFCFKFKKDAPEEKIAGLMQELANSKEHIPVLREFMVGKNVAPRTHGFQYGEIAIFEKKADLEILSDLKACSHSFALEIRPPNGKKAKATISWLVGKLSDLQFEKYKVAITWPGRGGETLIDLEQLIRFPETIYRGQKDAPRSIMLITGHRDVRRFKSRKRFIEDMEGNAIRLVQEAINRGFLSP